MSKAVVTKPRKSAKPYPNASLLVETAWLEKNLKNQNLRIIDCNVRMTVKSEGGYMIEPGLADWKAAHIPSSHFIDLISELSAPHPTLKFMMPTADHFARVMSLHGIGNKHRVVVYSRGANYWATRLFLMFRAMGHTKVQVLNGGWDKWAMEQRPTTTLAKKNPKAIFEAKSRPGQILNKAEMKVALSTTSTCVINALHPDVRSEGEYARDKKRNHRDYEEHVKPMSVPARSNRPRGRVRVRALTDVVLVECHALVHPVAGGLPPHTPGPYARGRDVVDIQIDDI